MFFYDNKMLSECSNLNFTRLTAEINSTNLIKIVRQNFGFNMSTGTKAELGPTAWHYYMEIRPMDKKKQELLHCCICH